jgi:hypothetical protein
MKVWVQCNSICEISVKLHHILRSLLKNEEFMLVLMLALTLWQMKNSMQNVKSQIVIGLFIIGEHPEVFWWTTNELKDLIGSGRT